MRAASLSIGKGPSAVASGGSRPPVWKVDVVTREAGHRSSWNPRMDLPPELSSWEPGAAAVFS